MADQRPAYQSHEFPNICGINPPTIPPKIAGRLRNPTSQPNHSNLNKPPSDTKQSALRQQTANMANSQASIIAVEDAPSSKVVRFAPEIMSSEAPNCASRSRKMSPCSDICHPIVFRKPYLSLMDSMEALVATVPKLAPSPLAPPGGAHGKVVVNPLSNFDVVSVCHYDAPAEDVAPSTNGSCNRGVVKDPVLVDSQTPLNDAMSSLDVLPIPECCYCSFVLLQIYHADLACLLSSRLGMLLLI
ncbi:hypothetical protein Nepgr_003906 [Nepenthes gracilis]|uniref:Uncharacterized protein n=1 Tax=Nepenthes gracilis TaxID=150966 RepID=A0AAD3XEF0_NEPGR|nr:hypothetical protein Nepgr_003906 [Nepenthes gracilis]